MTDNLIRHRRGPHPNHGGCTWYDRVGIPGPYTNNKRGRSARKPRVTLSGNCTVFRFAHQRSEGPLPLVTLPEHMTAFRVRSRDGARALPRTNCILNNVLANTEPEKMNEEDSSSWGQGQKDGLFYQQLQIFAMLGERLGPTPGEIQRHTAESSFHSLLSHYVSLHEQEAQPIDVPVAPELRAIIHENDEDTREAKANNSGHNEQKSDEKKKRQTCLAPHPHPPFLWTHNPLEEAGLDLLQRSPMPLTCLSNARVSG